MSYINVLFAVILMFAAGRGTSDEDQARLHGVAQDIWHAADVLDPPLIVGDGGKGTLATALVLTTVAGHESGFWSKVQDCSACWKGSPFCDKGRSVSIFQLHVGSGAWGGFSRQEICESNAVASKLALGILARHRRAGSALALFQGYALGGRRQAAGEMAAMWVMAARKARLVLRPNPARAVPGHVGPAVPVLAAEWAPGQKPPEPDPEPNAPDA